MLSPYYLMYLKQKNMHVETMYIESLGGIGVVASC